MRLLWDFYTQLCSTVSGLIWSLRDFIPSISFPSHFFISRTARKLQEEQALGKWIGGGVSRANKGALTLPWPVRYVRWLREEAFEGFRGKRILWLIFLLDGDSSCSAVYLFSWCSVFSSCFLLSLSSHSLFSFPSSPSFRSRCDASRSCFHARLALALLHTPQAWREAFPVAAIGSRVTRSLMNLFCHTWAQTVPTALISDWMREQLKICSESWLPLSPFPVFFFPHYADAVLYLLCRVTACIRVTKKPTLCARWKSRYSSDKMDSRTQVNPDEMTLKSIMEHFVNHLCITNHP